MLMRPRFGESEFLEKPRGRRGAGIVIALFCKCADTPLEMSGMSEHSFIRVSQLAAQTVSSDAYSCPQLRKAAGGPRLERTTMASVGLILTVRWPSLGCYGRAAVVVVHAFLNYVNGVSDEPKKRSWVLVAFEVGSLLIVAALVPPLPMC